MTLFCCFFFFYFYNFEYQGSTNVSVNQVYNQVYLVPEKKLILMFLLFLVTAAIPNPYL